MSLAPGSSIQVHRIYLSQSSVVEAGQEYPVVVLEKGKIEMRPKFEKNEKSYVSGKTIWKSNPKMYPSQVIEQKFLDVRNPL